MSAQHTPGPWSIFPHYCKEDSESIYAQTWLIGLGQFDTIAEVRPGHDAFDGQNDANARLIAAAPELLEAATEAALMIKQMSGIIGEVDERSNPWNDVLRQLRAAARKATGQ